MKTRENELHEPKITISVQCEKCQWNEDAIVVGAMGARRVIENIPNYCPNCGARLKEICYEM